MEILHSLFKQRSEFKCTCSYFDCSHTLIYFLMVHVDIIALQDFTDFSFSYFCRHFLLVDDAGLQVYTYEVSISHFENLVHEGWV